MSHNHPPNLEMPLPKDHDERLESARNAVLPKRLEGCLKNALAYSRAGGSFSDSSSSPNYPAVQELLKEALDIVEELVQ